MIHRILAFSLAVALLLAGPAGRADADLLYSAEGNEDWVVLIDTNTGNVTQLSPTFYPFANPRLALQDGLLWTGQFRNQPVPCPLSHVLQSIDPSTWTVASPFALLTIGGTTLETSRNGDMTSDGTTLIISYEAGPCDGPVRASTLADLAADGSLSNIADLSGVGADMTAIAAGPNGEVYAASHIVGGVATVQRIVRPATFEVTGTHQVNSALGYYMGMTFSNEGNLWALNYTTIGIPAQIELVRIDPDTGQIVQTVPLPPGNFDGLAPVPLATPARSSSWGRLKTIYR